MENRHCTSAHLSSYVTSGVSAKDKLQLDCLWEQRTITYLSCLSRRKRFWRSEISKTAWSLPNHSDHPDHASQITKLEPSPTFAPYNVHWIIILEWKYILLLLWRSYLTTGTLRKLLSVKAKSVGTTHFWSVPRPKTGSNTICFWLNCSRRWHLSQHHPALRLWPK